MALIRALLVLLLLLGPAGASAAPAPAPATGLEAEEVCVGIGTDSKSLACLGNLAITCLGASAATAESAYLMCFLGGCMTGQCLADPPPPEKGCIGLDISDERMICLGLAGWDCQGGIFGDAGFVACYVGSGIKCLVYK